MTFFIEELMVMLLEGRYSGYILNRCGFLKVKSKFFVNVCKGENENKFFFLIFR